MRCRAGVGTDKILSCAEVFRRANVAHLYVSRTRVKSNPLITAPRPVEGEKDSWHGKATRVDLERHPGSQPDEVLQNKEQLRARPGKAFPIQLPRRRAPPQEPRPGATAEHGKSLSNPPPPYLARTIFVKLLKCWIYFACLSILLNALHVARNRLSLVESARSADVRSSSHTT